MHTHESRETGGSPFGRLGSQVGGSGPAKGTGAKQRVMTDGLLGLYRLHVSVYPCISRLTFLLEVEVFAAAIKAYP